MKFLDCIEAAETQVGDLLLDSEYRPYGWITGLGKTDSIYVAVRLASDNALEQVKLSQWDYVSVLRPTVEAPSC